MNTQLYAGNTDCRPGANFYSTVDCRLTSSLLLYYSRISSRGTRFLCSVVRGFFKQTLWIWSIIGHSDLIKLAGNFKRALKLYFNDKFWPLITYIVQFNFNLLFGGFYKAKSVHKLVRWSFHCCAVQCAFSIVTRSGSFEESEKSGLLKAYLLSVTRFYLWASVWAAKSQQKHFKKKRGGSSVNLSHTFERLQKRLRFINSYRF